jgi:exopolyphosphatase/guanosine-5'-triphosphate,3'-diphosphate pyrophosphatase
MTILGAIDVGSNAMRLAIGEFSKSGRYKVLHTLREPVRLGHEVFRSGEISPSVLEQAVTAFLKFEKILKSHNVLAVRAVGTSALREAKNGAVLIERVKRATGIHLEVISGDEEARLIHLAVDYSVNLRQGISLLLDIGGGSVEISVVNKGAIVFSDSLRMGTVRLLEMMRGRRRTPQVIERLVREYAGGIRRQVQRGLSRKSVARVVGTGGNIETFGALRKSVLNKKEGNILRDGELTLLYDKLRKVSFEERIEKFKLRPDRADVIIPAGALLRSVLRESGVKTLHIPCVGLRDGILLDTFQERDTSDDVEPLQRRERQMVGFAKEFGRRFMYDEIHAVHVAKLCLQVFDGCKRLHQLDTEARILLHLAALLHDIGHFINGADHHKHSYYIIKESPFFGLSPEQKHLLATIARYHRGSNPSIEHSEWRNLTPYNRRLVMVLGGIIRMIEDVDREHLRRVSKITLSRRGNKLEISLHGRGELLVEKWGASQKKGLLELALGVVIAIN